MVLRVCDPVSVEMPHASTALAVPMRTFLLTGHWLPPPSSHPLAPPPYTLSILLGSRRRQCRQVLWRHDQHAPACTSSCWQHCTHGDWCRRVYLGCLCSRW